MSPRQIPPLVLKPKLSFKTYLNWKKHGWQDEHETDLVGFDVFCQLCGDLAELFEFILLEITT